MYLLASLYFNMHQYRSELNGRRPTVSEARSRFGLQARPLTIHCTIVVQARDSLASYVLGAVNRTSLKGIIWRPVASHSEAETLKLINESGRDSDVFAFLGTNSEPVKAALATLREMGIYILAFLSDLDSAVRSTYIGGDNRAGGRLAALIIGRCLEREADAAASLITSKVPYRAWEDREIGFRSLLRARFPAIRIIELTIDDHSPEWPGNQLAPETTNEPAVGAIYNVTGENRQSIEAASTHSRSRRPLYITHDFDRSSAALLRSGMIDFLIIQNLDAAINATSRILFDLRAGNEPTTQAQLVPTELLSKYNLQPEGFSHTHKGPNDQLRPRISSVDPKRNQRR
jgi:ABC-type sugar transport system substrate-binding protein